MADRRKKPDGGKEGKPAEQDAKEKTEEDVIKESWEVVKKLVKQIRSPEMRAIEDENDKEEMTWAQMFNFPRDRERWTQRDLQELWMDRPFLSDKPGWNPIWTDAKDWNGVLLDVYHRLTPSMAPFYVPYYKAYPMIPEDDFDVETPMEAVEELDRIEEFLTWVSYIFKDGSSYEGTIWDDYAHGKGVYVSQNGLFRYEGEWLQNDLDGHGVVEVEIPEIQPVPGSKLEARMRAAGKIIKRDYMSPEDRKWLNMDIKDTFSSVGWREIPFYERNVWKKVFGKKPEKGRYKYAGQWKHGHMHGCGVYEVNERITFSRFYFGIRLDDSTGCDADVSMLHAGIAEVAAAKARMFVNKPDGMVREDRGPYGDPQHPYFYEEEDVWMAPGFINQFYEVPDYWKTYVEEVDQEREMWLNSFYKAPLRIPMPPELEYWWENDENPEFILINKEPTPDPEDPSKLIYEEDPLIYHTRTGRIINYVDDEKYGVRLFWQPAVKEGEVEDADVDQVKFLPLGFDEFYGRVRTPKRTWFTPLRNMLQKAMEPMLEKLQKWIEEKQEDAKMNLELIKHEIDLVEARICLEEELEDIEADLKRRMEEERMKLVKEGNKKIEEETSMLIKQEERKQKQKEEDGHEEETSMMRQDIEASLPNDGKNDAETAEAEAEAEAEDEEEAEAEDEEEDENEQIPSSFGAVSHDDADQSDDGEKGKDSKSHPFSSLSLSLCTHVIPTLVPRKPKESFSALKRVESSLPTKCSLDSSHRNGLNNHDEENINCARTVCYPRNFAAHIGLRAVLKEPWRPIKRMHHYTARSQLDSLAHNLSASQDFKKARYDNGLYNSRDYSSIIPPIHSPVSDVGIHLLNLQLLHPCPGLASFCTADKY